MKSFVSISAAALLSLSLIGCTTAEQTAAGGAIGGAVIGAALDDNNRVRGAAIGAAVGGGSGFLLGRLSNGNCRYRAQDGSTYIAACP
ncbi:MAG: YMGG-like glycine zipper-containing protein [Ahrensia sp.]